MDRKLPVRKRPMRDVEGAGARPRKQTLLSAARFRAHSLSEVFVASERRSNPVAGPILVVPRSTGSEL